jgi:integrase
MVKGERIARITKQTEQLLDASPEARKMWVMKLFDNCKFDYERYAVSMLFIYGLRPAELLLLKKSNFVITDTYVRVRLPTLKTKKRKDPTEIITSPRRNLLQDIAETPLLDFVANYVKNNEILLPETWRAITNINTMFAKISKRIKEPRVSPYLFRHFRLSYISAIVGADDNTLKAWKGSVDPRSIATYTALRPVTKLRKAIGW